MHGKMLFLQFVGDFIRFVWIMLNSSSTAKLKNNTTTLKKTHEICRHVIDMVEVFFIYIMSTYERMTAWMCVHVLSCVFVCAVRNAK